jgi:hypothetical protein
VGRRRFDRALTGLALLACAALSACGPWAAADDGRAPDRAPVRTVARADPATLATRPLVGAHYYHWYPGNWDVGTLRAQLDPPQETVLGRYDSTDPAVAEQHIEWASAHGIDFFTLDWWPVHHQENQQGIAAFLAARNLDDIAFTIFYETWDLAFDPALGYADVDRPGVRAAFVEDMAQLADTYFGNPSYLRVDGRPVVILYLTRVLVGDVAGAMAEVRDMWRQRGYDPFVVADEVFWRVTRDGRPAAFSSSPQPGRIRLFDAITAYNPYESERSDFAGYGSESTLLGELDGLYARYRDATGGAVPIVSDVLPGYDDRGVRPKLDHYVIPRQWALGAPEGSFLDEMLRRIADPWFDPRAPLVFVTSWNEWNEDTGIEPLQAAPATSTDTATDGISRTQGFAFEGFGTRYLEVLRDHYVAVAGQVTGPGGEGAPGVLVSALRDGVVVAQDTTDAEGRYTLSRAQVGDGPVQVLAERRERPATPDPARTVLVDLAVGT